METGLVDYEIWAGRSDSGVNSYMLIPADDKSRKMLSFGSALMQELVGTISADDWDLARAAYEERYEQIAVDWEARNPRPR
jgi:hypothetical protein